MRNVFRKWMFGSNGGHAHIGGFAGFAEGIITRVEVFPFLESDISALGLTAEGARESKPLAYSGASPSCLASCHKGGGDVAHQG